MPDLDSPLVAAKRLVRGAARTTSSACSSAAGSTSSTSSKSWRSAACRPRSRCCPWSRARSTPWRTRARTPPACGSSSPDRQEHQLTQNWWADERRDVIASTNAALDYLQDLYDMHGDWHLALASYNLGENGVARAIERNRARGLPTDYLSLKMPPETRGYVPKLQALKNIIANPGPSASRSSRSPTSPTSRRCPRRPRHRHPARREVRRDVGGGVDRPQPRLQPPDDPRPHTPSLVLPADHVDIFHDNLAKHDDKSLVSWQTYQPKKGDTLERSRRSTASALAQLKEVNGIAPRARAMPALLVVPTDGARGARPGPAADHVRAADPVPGPRVPHTVKAGETLPGIARRYRVSVEDLRRWNKIGRLAWARSSLSRPGPPRPRLPGKQLKENLKKPDPDAPYRQSRS